MSAHKEVCGKAGGVGYALLLHTKLPVKNMTLPREHEWWWEHGSQGDAGKERSPRRGRPTSRAPRKMCARRVATARENMGGPAQGKRSARRSPERKEGEKRSTGLCRRQGGAGYKGRLQGGGGPRGEAAGKGPAIRG